MKNHLHDEVKILILRKRSCENCEVSLQVVILIVIVLHQDKSIVQKHWYFITLGIAVVRNKSEMLVHLIINYSFLFSISFNAITALGILKLKQMHFQRNLNIIKWIVRYTGTVHLKYNSCFFITFKQVFIFDTCLAQNLVFLFL